MYYFAYGSNLLESRMQARVPCDRVGIGQLVGYRLVFNLMVGGSGKCDVIETREPEDSVWGAIYSIPWWRIGRLDRYEGFPSIYHRQRLNVVSGKSTYPCEVYIGTGNWHRDVLPFDWYLHHVKLGAFEQGLPKEYQDFLAEQKSQHDANKLRFLQESQFWQH